MTRPETRRFEDAGGIPNSRLPVLVYHDVQAAGAPHDCEELFAGNGWLGAWVDGIFSFHHFHSSRIARDGSADGLRFKSPMSSFDEYFATVSEPQKAELERIRHVVRGLVPDAEEATSYGMPAFKYKNRPLLGLKASKNHLSVYPFSPEAIEAARDALSGFELSKGTVRFTPEKPIPVPALEKLLGHRVREIERV